MVLFLKKCQPMLTIAGALVNTEVGGSEIATRNTPLQ